MSTVDEIETAIATLSRFQFNETWAHCYSTTGDDGSSSIIANDGRVPIEALVPDYADLVVILHRTIDAQLAILRYAAKYQFALPNGSVALDQNALALARAINGTTERTVE